MKWFGGVLGALVSILVLFTFGCGGGGGGGGGGGQSVNPYSGSYQWYDNSPYNKGSLNVSGKFNSNQNFDMSGRKMVPYDDTYHNCSGEMYDDSNHGWYLYFSGIGTIYGHGEVRSSFGDWDIAYCGKCKLVYDSGLTPEKPDADTVKKIIKMARDGNVKGARALIDQIDGRTKSGSAGDAPR